jgi:hypothetical protein
MLTDSSPVVRFGLWVREPDFPPLRLDRGEKAMKTVGMVRQTLMLGVVLALTWGCKEDVEEPDFGGGNPGYPPADAGGGDDGGSDDGGSDDGGDGGDDGGSSGSDDGGNTTGGSSGTGGSTSSGGTSASSASSSGGDPECGNGVIDPGEQCDGANLNGFDCTNLGYTGGTLACDPVTCTFDTSMCESGGSSTSGYSGRS